MSGPGTLALVGAGCGTAIASVCAIGMLQIEQLLGGLWSVAAVLLAAALCGLLARAFARLSAVVPSGAGLLAFLSRGLGRQSGLVIAAPYFLLTLILVGAEATIVGTLLARVLPVPVAAGALLFLVGTWALCRAGVQIGYRAQAAATAGLVLCMAWLSMLAITGAADRGSLASALIPHAPSAVHFMAGTGEALFLFMGFELITSHAEIARSPRAIGRSLPISVGVLAAFYSLVSLGFSCLDAKAAAAGYRFVPQLAIAEQARSPVAVALMIVLSLLASFTCFNGALLALSRFACALAAQGTLPRRFGRLDPRTMVPRKALSVLLAVAIGATALVGFGGALEPAILAAAIAASLVYGCAAWVRERPPFAEEERGRGIRLVGRALALGLFALGVAVAVDAGGARAGTLLLVGAAYGGALLLARRARPARLPEPAHGD